MEVDNDFTKVLQTLGLDNNAAATYIAMLHMDTVSIRKVAAQTGINRGTTYEALKRLVGLGLVSVKRRGQREYFTAESPEQVHNLIRDKRRDLVDTQQIASSVIPKLLAKHPRAEGSPIVRYYEDHEGIVAILRDVLQTCRTLEKPEYQAYSSKAISQYLYHKFPKFTERRIAEGIAVRVIAVGGGGEPASYSQRKWLRDPQQTDLSSYTLIYGNKVAVISISDDLTPYGVIIEDSGVASMQCLLFDQLWSFL